MTADSSHNDGFGPKGSRRVPHSAVAASPSRGSTPNVDVQKGEAEADLEFDPTLPPHELVDFKSMLPPLELCDLEPTLRPLASPALEAPPTLAPETPLPRCLTDAAHASSRPASQASKIPPAPKVPRFSLPAARRPIITDEEEVVPDSEACLGLPTDRVLPGSPALVSTFRPKPRERSGYSVTHSCQEERVFPPRRARKAKLPTKRRR